jgi:Fe-Mn family superoxide dismutase
MKKIILFIIGLFVTCAVSAQFVQQQLPYSYSDLEPYIDARTMEIHYSKHHAGYVSKLNEAVKILEGNHPLDIKDIFENITDYSSTIRNNAGGHYNHEFFWTILTPDIETKLSLELSTAIDDAFGNFNEFKTIFTQEAISRFGSGWVWLIVTKNDGLIVTSTPNQDNPLMNDAPIKGTPILGIDLWEHAYYLKYQNRRSDYLESIWNVIDWDKVSELYNNAILDL